MKVAVTVVAAVSVTVHVAVPEHPPPLQPVKAEPAAGLAVRVTALPLVKLAEQLVPQLIPAGALVTVPEPLPDLTTDSEKVLLRTVTETVDAVAVLPAASRATAVRA